MRTRKDLASVSQRISVLCLSSLLFLKVCLVMSLFVAQFEFVAVKLTWVVFILLPWVKESLCSTFEYYS